MHPDIVAVTARCCVGQDGTFCTPAGVSADLPVNPSTRAAKGTVDVSGTPSVTGGTKLTYYACYLGYRTKQGGHQVFDPGYPNEWTKGVSGQMKVEGKIPGP